ncbi:hypothetical protein VTJ83DRAFT_322 [Remersonia thermophila]|uniref:CAP-Gly domain-containing protein n=1 Tax=Remersonia thermophila TaxID=72144 RepID=A0ABR4DM38_9PEZI
MPPDARIGERRSYDGALCTVRYVGEVAGTSGSWLGVEWDDPSRGKHDGQHKGVRYFTCRSKSPTAASFVRPTRTPDAPQTFLAALHHKYAGDPDEDKKPPVQIVFSGKVAEEVGFDKIRRKQAQLDELQYVMLDGLQIDRASLPDGSEPPIAQTCPKIKELDVSRNLFVKFGPVVDICAELKALRSLRANGNRFQDVLHDDALNTINGALDGITELALEDTLLSWDEVVHVASRLPSLTALHAGSNQLSSLTPTPPVPFASTLVSLHLEFNDFTSLADLAPLASLSALRNLFLKGNRISAITPPSSAELPIFGPNLQYLDLSYNAITRWSFVDGLPAAFPGLASLRLTHNPLYSDPDIDDTNNNSTAATTTNGSVPTPGQPAGEGSKGVSKSDEAFMLTIARLPSLRVLNFSSITAADRADAEMFYLSRIARQLAAAPVDAEGQILARHPRWKDLCEAYGEPAVVRRGEVDPGFLEARLVTVDFHVVGGGGGEEEGEEARKKTVQVPKSFDIYAVKGLVGRVFGLDPLKVRLVWETGEWDPVAGFDEAEGESEDEDLEAEWERRAEQGPPKEAAAPELEAKGGRWVKREVELRDGPRQFGYCVDGMEAKIRVERK